MLRRPCRGPRARRGAAAGRANTDSHTGTASRSPWYRPAQHRRTPEASAPGSAARLRRRRPRRRETSAYPGADATAQPSLGTLAQHRHSARVREESRHREGPRLQLVREPRPRRHSRRHAPRPRRRHYHFAHVRARVRRPHPRRHEHAVASCYRPAAVCRTRRYRRRAHCRMQQRRHHPRRRSHLARLQRSRQQRPPRRVLRACVRRRHLRAIRHAVGPSCSLRRRGAVTRAVARASTAIAPARQCPAGPVRASGLWRSGSRACRATIRARTTRVQRACRERSWACRSPRAQPPPSCPQARQHSRARRAPRARWAVLQLSRAVCAQRRHHARARGQAAR